MKIFKTTICVAAMIMAAAVHLATGAGALAQSSEPFNPFSSFKASAETWAMSKYGDVKPSLYTGAMHYSVPIYTYEDPDFTLPVSLEYNFDGYRPGQHSGTVGYGWNLNCGGVITRDIRGFPDDDAVYGGPGRGFVGYYRTVQDGKGYVSDTLGNNVFWSIYCHTICTDHPTLEMAREVNPFAHIPVFIPTTFVDGVLKPASAINYDLTPDIYHFVIPGHSGDFMFMPDGSIRVFNSDLPHGEVKIEFTEYSGGRTSNETYFCTFTIITGDGTRYIFGESRDAIDYSKCINTKTYYNMPTCAATAFHLKRIIAPNGRIMEFGYASAKHISVSGARSYTPMFAEGNYNKESELIKTKTFSYYSAPEEIAVDGNALIAFSYETREKDECAEEYYDDSSPSVFPPGLDWCSTIANKRLQRIIVYNHDGEVVERAELSPCYAPSGTPKMFLGSVSTISGGKQSFAYDFTRTLPSNDCYETDHWGYWNGSWLPDIRNVVVFSGSRYTQMTSGAKEPGPNYSKVGALTEISYPSGGTTRIAYEGRTAETGLDEEGIVYTPAQNTTINVGGVRACMIINHADVLASADTTTFLYEGGFLYHMPRYLFTMPMYYDNAYSGADHVSVNAIITGYNSDSDYSVSRDDIVGYAAVTECHPDGSQTRTEYSTYCFGNEDVFFEETNNFPYSYIAKRGVYSDIDYINEQIASGTSPWIAAIPFLDRRNMRGKPLRETIMDANGNYVRDVRYTYLTDAVHLNQVWWNDLDQFDCSPWTCYSPLLESETITDYADDGTATTIVHIMAYNAAGQVSVSRTTSPQAPGDTVSTYYKYYHETQEPLSYDALPGAVRKAVRTRSVNGNLYLTAAELRNYSAPSVHVLPSAVTVYQFGSPLAVNGVDHALAAYSLGIPEQITFTRDTLFRITRADLPGGAWVENDWDGNNIVQVRENASGNATSYQWKDLVGVTSITAPSGQVEGVDYDNKNRLWRRKDTVGRIIESYHYKLKNE